VKIILSSRRGHYLKRVSIFLIIVALVVSMIGCGGDGNGNGDGGETYTLTTASTTGGSVTTPGEAGPYTYDEGTLVNLEATPDAGYQFVNWTGDVGTIADVNTATTTITMNGDYAITANFTLRIPPFSISNIVATPTKIGNAAVITWDTDVPTTNNIVVYGQSSSPSTNSSPGLDNVNNHVVVISGLTPNSTYYYQVGVTYLGLQYVSSVNTFTARNAKNAWDGSQYTINMLITLTWDVPSVSDTFLTTWFTSPNSYMAQAAQYIYDATDGYIRLGTVIVVDNQQKGNAVWQTSDMTFEDQDDPATPIDERYQSYGGITPYTYYNSKWNHTPGIENASGGVGMQFGSLGPIRQVYDQAQSKNVYQQWDWDENTAPTQWRPMFTPGWQAHIITHEFGHYALYLPDRYDFVDQTSDLTTWDTNNTYDSDLMSLLGYWENSSTFRYYTEFGAQNCYETGYSDPFGEGNTFNQPPLWVDYSSWYIIINSDPFAGTGTTHYSNAYGGVEPAYPDAGPTNENGGAFNVIFINN